MTTQKTGSRSKRGPVGRSGANNGQGKTVTFRGLKLTLPPQAPGDLVFSLAEGQVSVTLREVFGDVQWAAIRAKCAEDHLSLDDVLRETDELIGKCLAAWGISTGE